MPSENTPRVTVTAVAPVHNRREITLQCVRSLLDLDTTGVELRIIIVDDASADGTTPALRAEFPDVEVIEGDGDLWYSEGTNVGIRRALELGTDFVWQINDDQYFDRNALLALLRTALRFPRSVVGSALILWDEPDRIFQVAPVWSWRLGGWRHWQKQRLADLPDGPFSVDMIVGNSMLVPAEAYAKAGLLDSKRFPMLGDGEFSPRLKRNGYELLVDPASRVFCLPNTPPKRLSEMKAAELYKALFGDARRPHNLRRRFRMNLATAPSKTEGLLAFLSFCLRAALGRSLESSFAATVPEPRLRDIFAARNN